MIAPEYIFYCLVIVLVVVCVVSLYWWWRDITITSIAMEIARARLEALGISFDSSIQETMHQLRLYSESQVDNTCQGVDRRIILASLYLLRGELHLNRTCFKIISEMHGFESSNRFLDLHIDFSDVRELLLKSTKIQRKIKRQRDIELAAERLNENFLELEQVKPRTRIAA